MPAILEKMTFISKNDMKEKRYKLPEDKGAAFVGEPTVAYHGNAAIASPDEDCVDTVEGYPDDEVDDFDWNRIPIGWGPANEEEACARIEAIEADIEKNGLIDAEELDRRLKAEFPWLA